MDAEGKKRLGYIALHATLMNARRKALAMKKSQKETRKALQHMQLYGKARRKSEKRCDTCSAVAMMMEVRKANMQIKRAETSDNERTEPNPPACEPACEPAGPEGLSRIHWKKEKKEKGRRARRGRRQSIRWSHGKLSALMKCHAAIR